VVTHCRNRNWSQLVPRGSHITNSINPSLSRHLEFVNLDVAFFVDFYASILQRKQVCRRCPSGPIQTSRQRALIVVASMLHCLGKSEI
jgi:hypothetical protein